MGSIKIFTWREGKHFPNKTRAFSPTAIVCAGSYSTIGDLVGLSPHATSKEELDAYVDSLIRDLENERRRAHRWFKREGL
jgi:hypothetical protein